MQDLSVNEFGEVYRPNRQETSYNDKKLKSVKRDMINMALWDFFIGLGFLVKSVLMMEQMKFLHENMFQLFIWTIVAEALYFISFGLEYFAFQVVKTVENIMKIRYAIDLI